MDLQGPDEMPHGRAALTLERYECEALASYLVEEYQSGRITYGTELGDLALLLAPVAEMRTCDGCHRIEEGGPEQDGEGRSECCQPVTNESVR